MNLEEQSSRIEELERRLARAEETITLLRSALVPSQEAGTTVRAPFRVMDGDGNLMCEVAGQRKDGPFYNEIRLFNHEGQNVASLGAEGGGGYLTVRDKEGRLLGYLDIEMHGARMQILGKEQGVGVVLLGDEEGGYLGINSEDLSIELRTTLERSEIEIWRNSPLRSVVSLFVYAKDERIEIRKGETELEILAV